MIGWVVFGITLNEMLTIPCITKIELFIIHCFKKGNDKHTGGTQFGISFENHTLCAQTKGYLVIC